MKKHIFFVFIFFVCGQNLFSAEFSLEEIDKIKQTRAMYNNASTYSLISQAQNYSQIGEYKKALDIARHAYIATKSIQEKARTLLVIGKIYEDMKDYNKAKLVYRQIIRNFSSMEYEIEIAKNRLLLI